ncbi:MAG: diaminopimelate decarboxylase [Clostridiales bacterium]|nr:diaminopimelate decarboxylase [Clostridiales bacterium]
MIRKDKIGGISIENIVRETGTPVYIYDEDVLIKRMREFKENFTSSRFQTRVLYASKAFACREIIRLAAREGLGLDVVSGGELHCAGGTPMDRNMIYFHGNNKTRHELKMALSGGAGTIVVDNSQELDELADIQKDAEETTGILIRINPGIEAHTHEYIATARKDSKFGISIDDRHQIREIIQKIIRCENLRFRGFHAHIGSQIFSREAFVKEIEAMAEYIGEMEDFCGIEIEELNLGGGFAVRYTDEDSPIPIGPLCRTIVEACEGKVMQLGLHLKRLTIEPGRGIAAEAGTTVYSVGYKKKTETKEYIFVDGGMADNIRPALYGAEYHCENISRPEGSSRNEYVVAGKCCESGDILIKSALLPETKKGDLLAVYTTGAYGYSMASNYNRLGRPAVVFASGGEARLIMRRETYEDMEALEINRKII